MNVYKLELLLKPIDFLHIFAILMSSPIIAVYKGHITSTILVTLLIVAIVLIKFLVYLLLAIILNRKK